MEKKIFYQNLAQMDFSLAELLEKLIKNVGQF